jgi:hypothetical protein
MANSILQNFRYVTKSFNIGWEEATGDYATFEIIRGENLQEEILRCGYTPKHGYEIRPVAGQAGPEPRSRERRKKRLPGSGVTPGSTLMVTYG